MIVPTSIRKIGNLAFRLTWPGEHVSEYSARYLRLQCQCAMCKHELTGERLIQSENVPMDIKIDGSTIVGNYALGFEFSDGHRTGIYTFETLRSLCPCCTTASVEGR